MKYTVDEIIDDIAIIIDTLTGDKKYINTNDIDFAINENDVLAFDNGLYKKCDDEKEDISSRIKNKMEFLKKE